MDKEIKIVYIEWEDATFNHDWDYTPEAKLAKSYSAGIVISENKECIAITPCENDLGAVANYITIPKVCIKKILILKRVKV